MDMVNEYLQPITEWVRLHPHWALLATFIVSFAESLAFVGTIIPGTVTMTAFGILAGSGMIRIDLTLIAAILGAIAGDSASYSLGYIFSERLTNMWPFQRYPQWLNYGKEYFERHGGKSVLIGRFTGPLRSIIPIIAGMMQMNRWHFLIANVTSAIGWSFLYVIPGILIGAASHELSPQSASKLFVAILITLGVIWIVSLGIKWLFSSFNQWLKTKLDKRWTKALQSPIIGKWTQWLTPPDEQNHDATAALFLLFLICLIVIPVFFYVYTHHQWAMDLNLAVRQFCLSIRTHDFDVFFIIARLDIHLLSLIVFGIAILCYAAYHRDWRLLKFWISLFISSTVIMILMAFVLRSPAPVYQLSDLPLHAFPTRALTYATALFGFLVLYMRAYYQQSISIALRILLQVILLLAGLALIYLGEDWLMNVLIAYLIGFTNALLHWILYRRKAKPHYRSYLPITLSIMLLLIASTVSAFLFYHAVYESQQTYTKQFDIEYDAWWEQKRPILPLYTKNRFGKPIALLNIQYVGNIRTFQETLEAAGWKKQLNSLFYSLILRMENQQHGAELPLMAQLYLSQKPYLMMTYGSPQEGNGLIIRFWRSNYHVHNHDQTIWIGSIQSQRQPDLTHRSDYIHGLKKILDPFKTRTVIINPQKTNPAITTSTILLLVQDNQ